MDDELLLSLHGDRPYNENWPYPLVPPDPSWLAWNDGTVPKLAQAIFDDTRDNWRRWERLPVLADALEEAGCTQPWALAHLRSVKDYYRVHEEHCWGYDCWVVRWVLRQTQFVRAAWMDKHLKRYVAADVLNPGDWFGNTWLVCVADCYDPPRYVVEADHCSDAIDAFVDDDRAGHSVRIDAEVEGDDYGHEEGGTLQHPRRKITLKGTVLFPGDPRYDYVQEYEITGQGVPYDGDNIHVEGDDSPRGLRSHYAFACRYYGPGIPEAGVEPTVYANGLTCTRCGAQSFDGVTYPEVTREVCKQCYEILCKEEPEDDDSGEAV